MPDRILRHLADHYPTSVAEVTIALSLRPEQARFEVKRLAAQGLVVVEEVGGRAFVALSGAGFRIIGLTAADAAKLRKGARYPPPPRPADDDPAYI